MILDSQTEFSNGQAITGTANSTNVIDTQPIATPNAKQGLGDGEDLSLYVAVGNTFGAAGAGTLTVSLVSADSADLATNPITHFATGVLALTALTAKARLVGVVLPSGKYRRYVGLVYTVATGPMTAGTINAGLAKNVQTINGTTDYAKGYTG